MSPDNISKQKARLEITKKQVAKSNYFSNHPLAYMPKAKGKEQAFKDQMASKKIGSLDLSNNRKAVSKDSPLGFDFKNNRSEFKIEPDRNAASLFFSKMPPSSSGKKGRHIADLIVPKNPCFLKNHFQKRMSEGGVERLCEKKDDSYLGYKGTAKLKVQVSKNRKNLMDLKMERNDLQKRLDQEAKDWPDYSKEDIFSQEALRENSPQNSAYFLRIEDEEKESSGKNLFWQEIEKTQQERESIIEKEETKIFSEPSNVGTTVKLSFAQTPQKIIPNENAETLVETGFKPVLDGFKPVSGGFKPVSFNEFETEEEEEPIRNVESLPTGQAGGKLKVERMNVETTNLSISREIEDRNNYSFSSPQMRGGLPAGRQVPEKFDDEAEGLTTNESYKGMRHTPNTTPYDENVVDLSKFSNDSFKNRQGISLPIQQQSPSEEVPTSTGNTFLPDYEPLKNYSYFENNNELVIKRENPFAFLSKIKKSNLFNNLKKIGLGKTEVLDLEWKNGRSYLAPQKAENDFDFRNTWLGHFLTRKEEKTVLSHFKKSKRHFKNNFFTFRKANSRNSLKVLAFGVILSLSIPLGVYVQKVIEAKNKIESSGQKAFEEVKSAKSAMLSIKPEEASQDFQSAYSNFVVASNSLDEVGGGLLSIIKVLPGGSKIKTGENVIEAGKHLTIAGQIMSEAFDLFLGDQGALKKKFITTNSFSDLKEVTHQDGLGERKEKAVSMTEALSLFQVKLDKAKEELLFAGTSLDRVNITDLPQDKQAIFTELKEKMPVAIQSMNLFSEYSHTILKVLGGERPKQYLFLFENNDEVRATGGFIGTYGLLKIDQGNISQMLIDGIYNPDGQLKERIIPPKPIQKMSATWSMHDANWWPDFPKSAEKISWFYEKTGGPPVDGVIAFTPKILEDFLKIIGPINHEKYDTIVDASNFVEITQQKVEKEYDKELNRPKQFLADLAPLILEKVFAAPPEKWLDIMQVFGKSLEERYIMIYFFDPDQQKLIVDLGWSGEMLETPKDYLSVVNTNISGLKTDKMIDQKIDHAVEIKPDGSIVDTVSITRHHRGGKEKYEWYNAVNSNYSRVYVPKGSELLQAEGYTREVNSPPLDYEKLGFVPDEDVLNEEKSTKVDPASGTLVYEDSAKTVFANWTYVSPGETLTLKYVYLLPFKINFDDLKKPADTYSLLIQKQAGEENSQVSSSVNGLENFDEVFSYSEKINFPEWKIEEKFEKDLFAGVVITEKGKAEKFKK